MEYTINQKKQQEMNSLQNEYVRKKTEYIEEKRPEIIKSLKEVNYVIHLYESCKLYKININ